MKVRTNKEKTLPNETKKLERSKLNKGGGEPCLLSRGRRDGRDEWKRGLWGRKKTRHKLLVEEVMMESMEAGTEATSGRSDDGDKGAGTGEMREGNVYRVE